MTTKNVPKCIREGIFCMMTGAMVFAAGSIDAQAAENDSAPADNNENGQE